MLQVLAQFDKFYKYLTAYEGLLTAINDEFPKIWAIAPSNAKEIINTIMSLDYVFVDWGGKSPRNPDPYAPYVSLEVCRACQGDSCKQRCQ